MSKGKILVVDDDWLAITTLSYGLTQVEGSHRRRQRRRRCDPSPASSGPQPALLDIRRMEGPVGFDVAAYPARLPQHPFMFLSAFADEETRP